jgi:hypothetical protein
MVAAISKRQNFVTAIVERVNYLGEHVVVILRVEL